MRTSVKISLLLLVICTVGIIAFVRREAIPITSKSSTTARLPSFLQLPPMSSSTMKLKSPAFTEGQLIPKIYTCDGDERSPELIISGVPKEARSLALFFEDPDTSIGTFTHWIVFNIAPNTVIIPEEMPKTTPIFGTPGQNGTKTTEYLGPCPPTGTHRYIFTLYALDTMLDLATGATKNTILSAMDGHTIAEARLMGKYGRNK